MLEAIRIAVDSIWSHKLRAFLTLLGIIIGVSSVVIVGGTIEGLESYVSDRLVSTFGSNTFLVSKIFGMSLSVREWRTRSRRSKRLYADDLKMVEERCYGCDAVIPRLKQNDEVKYGNHAFLDAEINGTKQELLLMQELEITQGRFISALDVRYGRPVAVLGADIQKELFATIDPLGKEIRIGSDLFRVIGIEAPSGSFFGSSLDSNVYIPYTAFMKRYGSRRSMILRVQAPSAESLEATEDEVRMILRSHHQLKPNQDDDFEIVSSDAMQDTLGQITGAIAAVITPITLISLVVGGIVVMNIMLVTVTERTREIGMRLAVGARRKDILMQFLVESSLLACLGGVFGLLLAYGVGLVLRITTPVPVTITAGYISIALVASSGVGILFGIYPAYRASRLDPIVALSRE